MYFGIFLGAAAMLNVFIYELCEIFDIFQNVAVNTFVPLNILLQNHICS